MMGMLTKQNRSCIVYWNVGNTSEFSLSHQWEYGFYCAEIRGLDCVCLLLLLLFLCVCVRLDSGYDMDNGFR